MAKQRLGKRILREVRDKNGRVCNWEAVCFGSHEAAVAMEVTKKEALRRSG